MLGAKPEKLDVREAQADGVDPDQELVGARSGDGDSLGMPVAADVLDARAVDVPGESRVGRRLYRRLPARGHFGLGRSAALRTFPIGSRRPIFVPIVFGLALKRSPGLMASH